MEKINSYFNAKSGLTRNEMPTFSFNLFKSDHGLETFNIFLIYFLFYEALHAWNVFSCFFFLSMEIKLYYFKC